LKALHHISASRFKTKHGQYRVNLHRPAERLLSLVPQVEIESKARKQFYHITVSSADVQAL
jgi:hypothetical protein